MIKIVTTLGDYMGKVHQDSFMNARLEPNHLSQASLGWAGPEP